MLEKLKSMNSNLYRNGINGIFAFLLPITLFRLFDSVLSYIFPIILEEHVSSNLIIGVIMALSSLIGLICDFLLPQILHNKSWRFFLIVGVVTALTFPIAVLLGDIFGLISIFVIAVVIWGVYYEFLLFSEQNYVVSEFEKEEYSRIWGVIGIIIDAVGIVAPILGSLILVFGNYSYSFISIFIQIIALFFALLLLKKDPHMREERAKSKVREYVSFLKEFRYWKELTKKIVPLLVMAFLLELISATFWVFGGLFGRELIGVPGLDWVVLVVSIVPTLIGSIIISKSGIQRRKKFYSQVSLLLGGLALVPFVFLNGNVTLSLLTIFLSSFLLSFSWPLNDAVYSDLQKRLDTKGIHLMGLSNAGYSVAYIIAPILMGFLSDLVGFQNAFSIVGVILAISALLLLLLTPRKLRMPHSKLDAIK